MGWYELSNKPIPINPNFYLNKKFPYIQQINITDLISVEIRHKREEVKETLTEDDLDKVVNLTLTETETIWLLDMPGTSVSNEAEEAAKIKKRNEEYQEVC